jgi:hypothetical protein
MREPLVELFLERNVKMSWLWAALSTAGILDSAICPSVVAELLGYRLLHFFRSYTLAIGSRSRNVSHFLLHRGKESIPKKRTSATCGRFSKSDRYPITPLVGDTVGLAIGLPGYRLRTPLDSQASEDARGTEMFQ